MKQILRLPPDTSDLILVITKSSTAVLEERLLPTWFKVIKLFSIKYGVLFKALNTFKLNFTDLMYMLTMIRTESSCHSGTKEVQNSQRWLPDPFNDKRWTFVSAFVMSSSQSWQSPKSRHLHSFTWTTWLKTSKNVVLIQKLATN